jgi:DNA polymerase III subunit delta
MPSEKPLLPVYLFCGDDQLKQEKLLKRLVARIAAEGDMAFNQANFDASKLESASEVLDACLTMPFCSTYRLVVVKDIDKARKSVIDEISAYLKDPTPTTVLVLTAEKLAKNLVLYKTIARVDAQAIIDCASKKRYELPALVRSMALSHGVTIANGAATLLIGYVGVSTIALDTELAKLADYARAQARGEIVEGDVRRLVARSAEVRPWELSDAMSARDTAHCLALIAQMPQESAYGLLAVCLTRVRELLAVKALERRSGTPSIATALGGPDWRYKNHRRWAQGFTERELATALCDAADAEAKMKSGTDPSLAFELWLLSVCRTTSGLR